MPPWEISYSGDKPGIVGILCYGEQPPPSLVVDTINGSLVAIVVIDHMKAIPGWNLKEREGFPNEPTEYRDSDGIDSKHSDHSPELQLPLILRTPEDIPYFSPANAISLDPRGSHSIGLALVRGIDVARRRIQVLTPIPPSEIEEINKSGKSIVLVSGKLDTPGWAYIEELTQKMHLEKSNKRMSVDAMIIDSEDSEESNDDTGDDEAEDQRNLGDGFQSAPWVEKLEGHQGRGIGSRVWRVRRDLGKDGGG
jgi:polynucleotide 5'-hydroxyl-kinase GRC3/NOL9